MKNLHWWLLLACIPLYGFWTVPALTDKRPTAQKTLQQAQTKFQQLEKKMAGLRAQQRAVATAEQKPTDIIPPVLAQEYLLLDLRRITQGSGFVTNGFSFSKGQNPDLDAAQMKATFNVEGNVANLTKLLKAIEENERFIGLASLNFVRANPTADVINLSVNLYALGQSL